jgi:probable rRNA maturation factor
VNNTLIIQNASGLRLPARRRMHGWIAAALAAGGRSEPSEIHIRFTDEHEMLELNAQYRGKRGTTNVLAFPAELPGDVHSPLLGDIAICVPVMLQEARSQAKSRTAHCAHLLVHGTLHLLGYDHVATHDAAVMESIESRVLQSLNYPCPYQH